MSQPTGHAVHLSFRLLARYFPFRPPPGKEHVTLEQLKPQFARLEIPVVLMLFVFAPLTIWACKIGLGLAFPPPPPPPGAVFQVVIDPMFMILPGIFLGLILAAAPVMGVMKLFLHDRFADYLLYGNLLTGFNTVKVWAAISLVLVAGALALAAAAAPVHLTVFADRLELRHLGFAPAVVRPLSDVAAVAWAPVGRAEVSFADGTHWSSTEDWSLLIVSRDVAQYLASQGKGRSVRRCGPATGGEAG